MKKSILIMVALISMVLASSEYTYASRQGSSYNGPYHSNQHNSTRGQSVSSKSRRATPYKYNNRPVTIVKPSRPKVVNRLPPSKYPIRHNGVNYYRNGSKYYKRVNNRYELTHIPFGVRVPVIPSIHSIFRWNNFNYYCAGGVIYREYGNEYEVMRPQPGMIVPELPMVNVSRVNIDGMLYFEFEGILYKQIPTVSGIQYEVVGSLYN